MPATAERNTHQPKALRRVPACVRALLQDAHEFLNWLLNDVSELLEREEKEARERSAARGGGEGRRRAGWHLACPWLGQALHEPSTSPPRCGCLC